MVQMRASKQRTKKQNEASMRNWQLRAIHATARMMFSLFSRSDRQRKFINLVNEEITERNGKTLFLKGYADASNRT